MSEPRTSPGWPLAVVSLTQTAGAVVAIVLGYRYDSEHMTPGILTLAGIGLIAGPGFWLAFRRAAQAVSKGGDE